MTLTRFQIRNEYGLADKELYHGANKDDPEALLEGSSMAGLVGVLRQLGDLSEFAAEVFNCLHEQVITTAARGHSLRMRLKQLEAELPPILSQTHQSTFFYDSGLEWRSYLQTEENLIAPRTLPPFISDSYEECRAPPQLFLLDKFDVAGSGSCLKRYSDPSLLKTSTASSLLVISKLSKDERPKKKTSKETDVDSHAKLHQLFSLEHVEKTPINPELHVKLKRRLLKAPINSSSGTCYMEKFLKNSSPLCERVHGTLDQSSPAMQTQVTLCSVQEDLPIPCLVYPNNEDPRKYNESTAATDERLEFPFVPQEITVSDKSLPNVEGGPAICLDRSSSVNLCCKVNNDTNEPASTESEAKEASEVFKVERDPMFIISPETFPGYLSELTQLPQDASEGGTKVLLTNYVEDDHSQHVSSVETGSEMSLSALVEDQFYSTTNQEKEALEPEVISSEAGHSTLDSKNSFKETPAPLESVFPLPNQYISISDNLEVLSLAVAAQDNVVPKEDETNSQDEQSGHISTSEFCSENGTLKSTSSCREDTGANPDLAEILSYPGEEDPQIMPIVIDDSYEPEVPIPDTQRHGTCFVGDVDHENQTGLNNKANETVPEIDLENIRYPQESLLISTRLSPEHCIQTQGQGLESPPETGSPSITALAEYLPTQDGAVGVQGSPAEEALTYNEKLFPSSITKIEALDAAHHETFTSLNDHIPEYVLSMDLTNEEDDLDVSPESMSLHETQLADPEITPPLPPLPPTEWWMGKLFESTENTHNGSVQASEAQYPSEASVTADGNHNYGVYTKETRVEGVSTCAQTTMSEPSKATEEHSPSTANGTSDIYMESTPKKAEEESFFLAETSQGLEADWRTEAMALEWFSQNLREHTNPDPVGKLEEEQTQLDHPLEPTGETKIPQTLRNHSSYDQNEKVGKVSRDEEYSLVIGIDRSMLRKVSERNRTPVGARVDENNSLLEIIRSKSFNLRPTEASVRPNFQVAVPKTNLKVVAILEKANTLRQAMVGSDDDHDSDSWSE